ncbi:MAG TPA: glycosyltransferase family 39 protein [Bacillota bacterium]|nr:glycosyltransferase family 39 protein [Bacillota bacterium]
MNLNELTRKSSGWLGSIQTFKPSSIFNPARIILFIFMIIKLLISLLPINYGIFRDELYFLAMSNRPDFGYVDVPPLAPLLLAANRFLLGDSFFALHLLPALSGVLFLWLAYRLVKKLGGNSYALLLILASVLLAGFCVYADSTYTYDTFSKFFWLLFSYLMIRLIQTEKPRYWIYLGIAAGFGLLFKITLLYLVLGWIIGLLFSKQRKLLWSWEVIGGGALALLIFSPYLIWQFQHGFITLDYYHHYISKVTHFSPLSYLLFQICALNPPTVGVWSVGLYWVIFRPEGRKIRSAGICYLVIMVFSFLMHAKPDLILPFYGVLLAAGSVWLGNLLGESEQRGWRFAIIAMIIISGLFSLPMSRPVIPVKFYNRVYGVFSPVTREENNQTSQLPQILADRFGWEEMTAKIAKVYRSLPSDEQAKTCILTGDYGEAGAIEFYGKKYGLPLPPVSGYYQYHIWGPGRFNGNIVISIGIPKASLEKLFLTVRTVTFFSHPYIMPHMNQPIYLCRDPLQPFSKMKPWFKWLD